MRGPGAWVLAVLLFTVSSSWAGQEWYLMVPPLWEVVRRMPSIQKGLQAGGRKALVTEILMDYVIDAPLHEWQRVRTFESAQACRQGRQAAIDAAEARPELAQLLEAEIAKLKADLNHPNEAVRAAARLALPLFESRWEKERQAEKARAKLRETEEGKRSLLGMRAAQCVTSDDPRLK